MNEGQMKALPQWDLTAERLPVRSTLYAPTPIGLGTPLCESLTSYLARLAEAHCVYPGVLLQEMIVPLMAQAQEREANQHPMFRRDGSGSHLINVTDPRARAVLSVLETLTLRSEFHALSLVALALILPIRGLARNRLAWCPVCYEEWRVNGQVLYTPLLWVFREISLCTRHGIRLQMHCPHCARSLPHLAWRSQPGYCAFCVGPLGGSLVRTQDLISRETPEFVWQQWVTTTLGAVVTQLPLIGASPQRERIRQVVNQAAEQLANGNVAKFARLLGLPRNTVENWCCGKRIPEMDMLLRLCYRLDLSLCEVLFEEKERLQPSLREPVLPAFFPSRKRTAINQESVSQQLEIAASGAENPPPSLKEVGLRLGYQPTTLYKINRAACHAIAERFSAYRRELREKRLQGYREEIRRIALSLQAKQVMLTRRHIARYLTQPAILRDPKVRALLREVCHELEPT